MIDSPWDPIPKAGCGKPNRSRPAARLAAIQAGARLRVGDVDGVLRVARLGELDDDDVGRPIFAQDYDTLDANRCSGYCQEGLFIDGRTESTRFASHLAGSRAQNRHDGDLLDWPLADSLD